MNALSAGAKRFRVVHQIGGVQKCVQNGALLTTKIWSYRTIRKLRVKILTFGCMRQTKILIAEVVSGILTISIISYLL